MQIYRNIVFDLGNVILDIDPQLSVNAFDKLGFNSFSQMYTLQNQLAVFDALEKGEINDEDFCESIRKITGLQISNNEIYRAWNALILEFRPENIAFLVRIRSRYRCFILSNTNSIHYRKYNNDIIEMYGIPGLGSLVDGMFLSHNLGLRKPDEAIFRKLEELSAIQPGETLFIDDVWANCKAAESCGWSAMLYDGPSLPAFFERHNLPV
ncbi:MAG TPA: HAD family phosphatase [Bacteroidales bacterium]|nr:HAD family phosphatase [Bacteroidales bacterium]